MRRTLPVVLAASLWCGLAGVNVWSQTAAAISPSNEQRAGARVVRGRVRDALGRPLAGAEVSFLAVGAAAAVVARSDASGRYELRIPAAAGTLQATAPHFSSQSFPLSRASGDAGATFTLALMPVEQSVVVAADALPTPEAQVGLPVTTITGADLRRQQPVTAVGALRLQPGVSVLRTGQVGGLATVSIRGGDGSFTKVLVDGIPVQRFDYGSYDFSSLAPAGIEEMQIVRGPDSVIYGSDAVAGVIDIQTRKGSEVPSPEWHSDFTGGDYATLVQTDSLMGSWRPFDYAFHFSSLNTQNNEPNAKDRSLTYDGNAGVKLPDHAELRVMARRTFSASGQPNALLYYGLADDSFQRQGETYGGVTLQQQTARHWFNRWRVSQGAVNYHFVNPSPTGTAYNSFGSEVYLGNPVTITGANGYVATGQAILDYGGTYPSLFGSDTLRRDFNWESVYSFSPGWNLIGGYRYYDEHGLSANETLSRHDHGVYAEMNGALWNRLFASAGISTDRDTPFGTTTNPQASIGWFPHLSRHGWLNETRLRASGGTALKDPDLFQEQSSLYQELATAPGGSAVLAKDHIGPIHPQRSHNFDAGIDQYLLQDKAQVSVTVFDNRYYDLIQYVPNSALPLLGVPADAAQLTYGANVNSLTESAKGLEITARTWLADSLQIRSSYTYTHARVLASLSSDAMSPSVNPAFPDIPIGAYAPLVGDRPFRVAPETGSVEVIWEHPGWTVASSFYASSRRNDSTFLSDANFGSSLLLPNHDLAPAFGVVNLSGYAHVRPAITLHAAIDNLFNQRRQEIPGYPMLGTTVRAGVEFTLHPFRR